MRYTLDLPALRRVPVQMIVGAEDTETWEIAEPGIDAGGDTRVERLRTLRDNWEAHGIPVRLEVVPGMGPQRLEGRASHPALLLRGAPEVVHLPPRKAHH